MAGHPRRSLWLLAGLLLCGHTLGCASLLARGRYPEALEHLAAEEPAAASFTGPRRARYALYRGLAHLALGDAPATARWLGEAKARFDDEPTCLSPEDAGRLRDAWTSVGGGL
jgi:hypothetical protein